MVLQPVDYVFFIFGGATALAKAVGVTPAAVIQWRTRGHIPNKRMPQLLQIARVRGLDLKAIDMIEGREMDGDGKA